MHALPYDIVIATRNRPEALRLSLPRMISQRRAASCIIVADSSDDTDAARRVVREATEGGPVPVRFHAAPRGLTRQRNLGLAEVRSPVVMFPDDDSIWDENVAAAVMDVYDRDSEQSIGAVCAAEAPRWPVASSFASEKPYPMAWRDQVRRLIGRPRAVLEARLFPDPFIVLGRSFWPAWRLPAWSREEDVVPVEYMTGFRMSFRTDVIRSVGFDETLTEYGLFEDADASFGVMQKWAVVGARKARVFHHKDPRRRGDGRTLGATQILNRAYVVCKHAAPEHPARQRLLAYCKWKVFQYRFSTRQPFQAARLEGAAAAAASIETLIAAPSSHAKTEYRRLITSILGAR